MKDTPNFILHDEQAVFDAFEPKVSDLFTIMWAKHKKPVLRRPNISLRLLADGHPSGKLLVLPDCHRNLSDESKSVNPKKLHYEFWTEHWLTPVTVKWQRRLDFKRGGLTRWHKTGWEEDVRRSLDTMRAFVEDATAVLARNHDFCCVCGKRLTDEQSRSRGIGPECLGLLDWCVFRRPEGAMPRSIVAADRPPKSDP